MSPASTALNVVCQWYSGGTVAVQKIAFEGGRTGA